jgi:hypothetical protein
MHEELDTGQELHRWMRSSIPSNCLEVAHVREGVVAHTRRQIHHVRGGRSPVGKEHAVGVGQPHGALARELERQRVEAESVKKRRESSLLANRGIVPVLDASTQGGPSLRPKMLRHLARVLYDVGGDTGLSRDDVAELFGERPLDPEGRFTIEASERPPIAVDRL